MKRCFIAIKIPYEIQVARLLQLLKKNLSSSRINWVEPENIHLTLAFLGEISEKQIHSALDILKEVSLKISAIDLEIKGFGTFGRAETPSVLWLGIEPSPGLTELKLKLDIGLQTTGYIPDHRAFQPHLTLGRVKFFNNAAQLNEIKRSYVKTSFLKFSANHINMYESKLSGKGPEYIVIREFPLQS